MQGETILSYKQAREYLDSLQFHKIKLGLQPMRDFHAKLGNPETNLKIVHVAGTNGKGSVCSALVSVMAQAGYKTGIYTSPHLSSARERFRINDSYISKDDFARLTTYIQKVLNGRPITYFEFTTSLALLWFYEQEVDLVVLETGLGGRLDATNIIRNPLVTIVTSISMDHEAYLGTTIEEVASEKAGIIKQNVPVIATTENPKVLTILEKFVKLQNTQLYLRGRDFHGFWHEDCLWTYEAQDNLGGLGELDGVRGIKIKNIKNAKPGAIPVENASAVVTCVRILQNHGFTVTEKNLRVGLAKVFWPGRQELIEKDGKRFLLDGAHNPAGVQSLSEVLALYSYEKLFCVWGAMADKDIAGGLQRIAPCCDHLLLANVKSDRTADPKKMMAVLSAEHIEKAREYDCAYDALCQAMAEATANDLILVAGSLYLIGELRPHLAGGLV